MTLELFAEKGARSRSRDTLNFWGPNANSSKNAKATEFKLSKHAPRVEFSTAVVKVYINVIHASLTQNQCLQCVTPPLTHVEIPRPHDATELNNDGMINYTKQNRIY